MGAPLSHTLFIASTPTERDREREEGNGRLGRKGRGIPSNWGRWPPTPTIPVGRTILRWRRQGGCWSWRKLPRLRRRRSSCPACRRGSTTPSSSGESASCRPSSPAHSSATSPSPPDYSSVTLPYLALPCPRLSPTCSLSLSLALR